MPLTDKYLTCLVCGGYGGGDQPVHSPGPGWVLSGGIAGQLQVCPCCRGHHQGHPAKNGVPKCQYASVIHQRREWLAAQSEYHSTVWGQAAIHTKAIETYEAEAPLRVLAALTALYGTERATAMMAEDPPL